MRNLITCLPTIKSALIVSALMVMMLGFVAPAEVGAKGAWSSCGLGYITQMEWLRHDEYGSDDTKIALRIDNTGFAEPLTPPETSSIVNGEPVIVVWWDGSGNRDQFQQFLTMAQMAFVGRMPVNIQGWTLKVGEPCLASDSKNFILTVCTFDADCNTAD